MSRDGALARARALAAELQKRGVKTSIEIQQGRPGTPNGSWFDTRFIGSMGHHIVSTRSQGLTPALALVKKGRTDVPGPLCNAYLGFDNVARIICMGWANHPGAGGPITLPGGRVPKDGARPYMFGWEIEGGLRESDWPASFRIIMGKCHAATLAWLKRDERSHIEHKTWAPARKIDRLNYTLTKARGELKPWLTITEKGDDDMFTDADRASLRRLESVIASFSDDKVERPDAEGTAGMRFALQESWEDTHELTERVPWQSPTVHDYVRDVLAWRDPADPSKARLQKTRYLIELAFWNSDRIWRAVSDTKKLAAALAPLLPTGNAPTQEQLEAALKRVLGSLDDPVNPT